MLSGFLAISKDFQSEHGVILLCNSRSRRNMKSKGTAAPSQRVDTVEVEKAEGAEEETLHVIAEDVHSLRIGDGLDVDVEEEDRVDKLEDGIDGVKHHRVRTQLSCDTRAAIRGGIEPYKPRAQNVGKEEDLEDEEEEEVEDGQSAAVMVTQSAMV